MSCCSAVLVAFFPKLLTGSLFLQQSVSLFSFQALIEHCQEAEQDVTQNGQTATGGRALLAEQHALT